MPRSTEPTRRQVFNQDLSNYAVMLRFKYAELKRLIGRTGQFSHLAWSELEALK